MISDIENPQIQNEFDKVSFLIFFNFIFVKVFEFLEENSNVLLWDQNKKYRVDQEDINMLVGIIESKIQITPPDFESSNKKFEKKQNTKNYEGNNQNEFSKKEEVLILFKEVI